MGGWFICFTGIEILFSQERAVLDGILSAIFVLVVVEATLRLTGKSVLEYYFQNLAADSGVRRRLGERPLARDLFTVVGYIGVWAGFGILAAGELRSSEILLFVSIAIVMLSGAEVIARWNGGSVFRYSFRDSAPE